MKRNLLLLIAVAFIMTACNQNKNFNVNVSLANGNDKTVYLQKYVDNVPVTIDSAVIAEEKAVYQSAISEGTVYNFNVRSERNEFTFF